MYVRAVKRSIWERLRNDHDGAIEDAAAELVRTGPGVSVFECRSRSDVELVAVALAASRIHRQPFHFVEIDPSDLGEIDVIPSPGRTPLPDANRLHRDLDLSGENAHQLVARLEARAVEVEVITANQLCALARRLSKAGQPIPVESWLLR